VPQVLAGIVEGKENVEIADQLGLSVKTVRARVTATLRIMGAPNRTHAAVIAIGGSRPSILAPPRLTGVPGTSSTRVVERTPRTGGGFYLLGS
jgi:hypothetical protein